LSHLENESAAHRLRFLRFINRLTVGLGVQCRKAVKVGFERGWTSEVVSLIFRLPQRPEPRLARPSWDCLVGTLDTLIKLHQPCGHIF